MFLKNLYIEYFFPFFHIISILFSILILHIIYYFLPSIFYKCYISDLDKCSELETCFKVKRTECDAVSVNERLCLVPQAACFGAAAVVTNAGFRYCAKPSSKL